ncbi:hypothetical protein PoB_006977600 [Plakobranchus ocellatus]|uniref:Uncharacterized protein n=1 Tax=Plakobranchus ocellatus TaxID=259542 RepID=A0AAV4DGK0_9GAST|nr:hypothetical protein PoB_006977600 [Plakobranchus ocellatus]
MNLISATIAAALVPTVLAAEEFCDPASFTTQSFDGIQFVPVRTIYNADLRASFHENLIASGDVRLLDFKNGRVYVGSPDGSCTYYENENAKAFGGAPPSGLQPVWTVNDPDPFSSFSVPVGNLEFRTLQRGSGDDCKLVYFSLFVDSAPSLVYFHADNEDATADDLKRVEDVLTQFQLADCTLVS